MSIETLNYLLALGTLVMQVVAMGFLMVYLLRPRFPDLNDIGAMLEKWGTHMSFLLTLAAIFFTLLYSEVLGFEPCFLCWWQRVFMYPQAVIFALAIWNKESRSTAALYSIYLSCIGALFAAYHHAMQVFPAGHLPCSANGPSCAKITFIEFGYITYPMMALSLFALLVVLQLFAREKQK